MTIDVPVQLEGLLGQIGGPDLGVKHGGSVAAVIGVIDVTLYREDVHGGTLLLGHLGQALIQLLPVG